MEQKQFVKVDREWIRYLADIPPEAISKIQILLPYAAVLSDPSVYLRRFEDTHIADQHADDYVAYLSVMPSAIAHPTHIALYPKAPLGISVYSIIDNGNTMLMVGLQLSSIDDPTFRNTVETMYSMPKWKYEDELSHGKMLQVHY